MMGNTCFGHFTNHMGPFRHSCFSFAQFKEDSAWSSSTPQSRSLDFPVFGSVFSCFFFLFRLASSRAFGVMLLGYMHTLLCQLHSFHLQFSVYRTQLCTYQTFWHTLFSLWVLCMFHRVIQIYGHCFSDVNGRKEWNDQGGLMPINKQPLYRHKHQVHA